MCVYITYIDIDRYVYIMCVCIMFISFHMQRECEKQRRKRGREVMRGTKGFKLQLQIFLSTKKLKTKKKCKKLSEIVQMSNMLTCSLRSAMCTIDSSTVPAVTRR